MTSWSPASGLSDLSSLVDFRSPIPISAKHLSNIDHRLSVMISPSQDAFPIQWQKNPGFVIANFDGFCPAFSFKITGDVNSTFQTCIQVWYQVACEVPMTILVSIRIRFGSGVWWEYDGTMKNDWGCTNIHLLFNNSCSYPLLFNN